MRISEWFMTLASKIGKRRLYMSRGMIRFLDYILPTLLCIGVGILNGIRYDAVTGTAICLTCWYLWYLSEYDRCHPDES